MKQTLIAVLLSVLCAAGCGGGSQPAAAPATNTQSGGAPAMQSPPPAPSAVFIGDSITARWNLAASFPGAPYTDAGISGEDTAQILARFDTDVIARHPQIVVVLAGMVDVLHGLPQVDAITNVQQMIQKAQAANIRVIVGTLPPVALDLSGLSPAYANHDYNPEILSYNAALTSLGVTLADYHKALAGPDGLPLAGVLVDGVHPTSEGYTLMTTAVSPLLR